MHQNRLEYCENTDAGLHSQNWFSRSGVGPEFAWLSRSADAVVPGTILGEPLILRGLLKKSGGRGGGVTHPVVLYSSQGSFTHSPDHSQSHVGLGMVCLTALLRYNLHSTDSLRYTIQWFLVNLSSCAIVGTGPDLEHLHHSRKIPPANLQ